MKSCPQKTQRKQSNRPSECIWWKMLVEEDSVWLEWRKRMLIVLSR